MYGSGRLFWGKRKSAGREIKNTKESESSEGQFFDGVNLSGRIMDFSDTVFQIVYFSRSAQAEVSREDADKSSIQKDIDLNIFGTCQDEKHWTADKVVITRWQ